MPGVRRHICLTEVLGSNVQEQISGRQSPGSGCAVRCTVTHHADDMRRSQDVRLVQLSTLGSGEPDEVGQSLPVPENKE